jgi:hypothetical protein
LFSVSTFEDKLRLMLKVIQRLGKIAVETETLNPTEAVKSKN